MIPKSLRSFENLNSVNFKTAYDVNSNCSYVSTKQSYSKFYQKHINHELLADYPLFSHAYYTIKSKVFNQETYIRTKYSRLARNLKDQLKEIGFTDNFQGRVFDILFKGCGVMLVLFDNEGNIRAIPFYYQNEELVRVKYNLYGDKIVSIEVKEDVENSRTFFSIDLESSDYYILYNQKHGDTYQSNLTIASPYILAQNALTARTLNFAKRNFTEKPIITPNIDRFVKDEGQVSVVVGGETMNYASFLTNTWKHVQKQAQQEIEHSDVPILPFDVKITNLTQNNQQNQTDKERSWLDEKIQISCFVNGSSIGRDNTANRAVSEQARDDLEETTVVIFQQLISKIANEFLIPKLYPLNYHEFFYEFYSVETDETIKLRDQNLRLLDTMKSQDFATLLTNNNLKISKEQIIDLVQASHGLDLLDQEDMLEDDLSEDILQPDDLLVTDTTQSVQSELDAVNVEILNLENQDNQVRAFDSKGNYYEAKTKQEKQKLTVENKQKSIESDKQRLENNAKRLDALKLEQKKLASKLEYLANPANKKIEVKTGKKGRKKGVKNGEGQSTNRFYDEDEYSELRAVNQDKLDQVFSKYYSLVNMSASELINWKANKYSLLASLDRSPIDRNIELLSTNKKDWTDKHLDWANKTIGFISRMKNGQNGQSLKVDGKDINWTKRDISLKNWAYDVNKNNRSATRAIKDLPVIEFSDVEKSGSVTRFLSVIKKALIKQYKDIANNSIRVNKGKSQFEDYLSKKDFRSNLVNFANDVLDKYNQAYNSSLDTLPDQVLSRIDALVDLTYNGGLVDSISSNGDKSKSQYKGFDNTQAIALNNLVSLDQSIIDQLSEAGISSFKNNLLVGLFNETYEWSAVEDGAEWIGCDAKNDKLVRKWHLANSGFAWKLGTNPPNTTNRTYYLEFSCRCSRYYGTKEQLAQSFKIYESDQAINIFN